MGVLRAAYYRVKNPKTSIPGLGAGVCVEEILSSDDNESVLNATQNQVGATLGTVGTRHKGRTERPTRPNQNQGRSYPPPGAGESAGEVPKVPN